MNSNLKDNIVSICKKLNSHSVEYLIIGGTAVALQGYFRHSTNMAGQVSDKPDLDFWYNPTYDNYFRLLNTLEELGQDISEFKNEKTPNPKKSFFKFDYPYFTLDFLPTVIGNERFRDLYQRREIANVNETEIYFLGYEDLITIKMKTARPKDLIDIEQLKEIKRNKSSE